MFKTTQITSILVSLFILLSSCNNKNNSVKNSTNSTIKKHNNYKSLFLGLSPQMSDKEFSNKIVELNKSGKLENNKFPLLIDGEEFLFEINKKHNSIKLSFKDEYTLQKKCKSSLFFKQNRKEFLSKRIKFNKYKISFINILKKKYSLNKFQFPKNFNFDKIGLECYEDCSYTIFVDKDKYVVFGTSIYGLEDYYILTGNKYNEETEKENVFDKLITNHNYGISIFIHYFSIQEFDKLYKEELTLEKKYKKYEDNKIQKLKKNSEQL